MSKKIHVTDDGPKECRAKTPASCRAKRADGSPAQHFSNEQEAQQAYDQDMKQDLLQSVSKPAKRATAKKTLNKKIAQGGVSSLSPQEKNTYYHDEAMRTVTQNKFMENLGTVEEQVSYLQGLEPYLHREEQTAEQFQKLGLPSSLSNSAYLDYEGKLRINSNIMGYNSDSDDSSLEEEEKEEILQDLGNRELMEHPAFNRAEVSLSGYYNEDVEIDYVFHAADEADNQKWSQAQHMKKNIALLQNQHLPEWAKLGSYNAKRNRFEGSYTRPQKASIAPNLQSTERELESLENPQKEVKRLQKLKDMSSKRLAKMEEAVKTPESAFEALKDDYAVRYAKPKKRRMLKAQEIMKQKLQHERDLHNSYDARIRGVETMPEEERQRKIGQKKALLKKKEADLREHYVQRLATCYPSKDEQKARDAAEAWVDTHPELLSENGWH